MIIYNRKFFANRLASLRVRQGSSAREMSLAIGQSQNYINKIEGEKAYPSMAVFFQICDYLNITPKDFFDVGSLNPARLDELAKELYSLDEDVIDNMLAIARKLNK